MGLFPQAGGAGTAAGGNPMISIGLGLLQNPFFTDEPVEGGRFFNAILLAYALPGLLALLLSRLSRHVRPGWYGLGAALLALVLLFATASLEVRRGLVAHWEHWPHRGVLGQTWEQLAVNIATL